MAPFLWPATRRDEAVLALARAAWGVATTPDLLAHAEQRAQAATPAEPDDPGAQVLAARMGLNLTPFVLHYDDVTSLPERAPLWLELPGGLLVVVARQARRVQLLMPDERRQWLATRVLVSLLRAPLEATQATALVDLLSGVNWAGSRRSRVRTALLDASLGWRVCARGLQLELPAGAAPWRQAWALALPQRLVALLGTQALSALLGIGAWTLVGWGALAGRLDHGALTGFALLLSTLAPIQALGLWLQNTWLLRAGALAKRRLLAGLLNLDVDSLRRQGAGAVLARVLETEAFEGLALDGGLRGLLATLELGFAALVLAYGSAGRALTVTLAGWCLVLALLGAATWRARQRWTDARLELTDATVEHLLGLRTRLVQQRPHHWHVQEDAALASYLDCSRDYDVRTTRFGALAARGFLLTGLSVLGIGLASGIEASPGRLAASFGGLLLAQRALAGIVASALDVAGAVLSYRRAAPLLEAGRTPTDSVPTPALALETARARHASSPVLLETQALAFAHGPRTVLTDVSLHVRRGDRVLIEGPSGGGKSTLAALLAGLRIPHSGRLRLRGYEHAAWGHDAWRAGVTLAPQFHENHVFSGSLAFNLLIGRAWPPHRHDLDEALAVCQELGLGELLARMPGGLHQAVGEAGWQLSHGESSRVFLARALLQHADVVILDESLAAMDAQTLELCLASALKRAPSLILIAHP
jgi:ATP-binding cassette subfamily B protein